jgi:hypothetical protein
MAAAAWLLAAHAQESATMRATEAATATLPQVEMARVKPVDRLPPNLRLSDDLMAGLERVDLVADRVDDAGTLHADGRGIARERIAAGAVLDVDVIEPDRGLPD